MDSRHDSHSFRLRVEGRMPQKTPDEFRRLIVFDIQPHQAIRGMCPAGSMEILIQSEERRLRQTMQKRNQILILSAQQSDIHSHDSEANAPLTQPEPLFGGQVFVEHQHGIP